MILFNVLRFLRVSGMMCIVMSMFACEDAPFTPDFSADRPIKAQRITKKKKVLIIGIDGVRPDALQRALTPNLDALISSGIVTYNAFAGGVPGTATEQKTLSGPGWSSILTGVWVNKHGVTDNRFQAPNYAQYPHFFKRLKAYNPQLYLSSLVNWKPINHKILSAADYQYTSKKVLDTEVIKAAAAHLKNANPDVVFVYFGEVDLAGHTTTFSPANPVYLAAITLADYRVGKAVAAIKARPGYADEDWLIIVTTDHGGKGLLHGGQSPEERNIFIIVSGNGARRGVVTEQPGMVVLPSTVAAYLDIPILQAWGWEGAPFGLKSSLPMIVDTR